MTGPPEEKTSCWRQPRWVLLLLGAAAATLVAHAIVYNFVCDDAGCRSTIVCGDGQIAGGEICDDGNTDDGDGCSSDCWMLEPGFDCPFDLTTGEGGPCNPEDPCQKLVPPASCFPDTGDALPYCGDGEVNRAVEECDDGNTTAGDGCNASCQARSQPSSRVTSRLRIGK